MPTGSQIPDTAVSSDSTAADGAFVLSRVFEAPRALVYEAWTEPEALAQWWGPKGFKIRIAKLDFRPGGVFHYAMQLPNGNEMWGRFVYREIVPSERIVFVNSFSDENESVTRHPMCTTWPLEVLSTVEFADQEDKTVLTLSGVPINPIDEERKTFEAGRESMRMGFRGTLDQLGEYLARS